MGEYANATVFYNGKDVPLSECAKKNGFDYAVRLYDWQKTRFKKKVLEKEAKNESTDSDDPVSQALEYFKGNIDEKPQMQEEIDKQFMKLGYDSFFGNGELMSKLANKTALYLILMKNKIDWPKNEKLNLYQDYFVQRKKIVASLSRLELARMLGCSPRTVSYWLRQLEKDDLIKIERIHCDEDDDRRHKYNVYILGEVMNDGSHRFYGH